MREGRGRSSSSDSRGGRGGADKKDDKKRTLFRRRKVCKFCADKIDDINYKDVKLLGPFVPERGKILPRRISGTCATHQRKLQTAIKRARQLALTPTFRVTVTEWQLREPWKSSCETTSKTSASAATW